MGFGPFSSDSSNSQTSTTVSGSGQFNQKSDVAQGGSVLVGKNAKVGNNDKKINAKGNVTITEGLQASDFKSIIGELTAATPAQVQQASPVVITAPAAAVSPTPDLAKLDYMKYAPALLGALALGLFARFIFKK